MVGGDDVGFSSFEGSGNAEKSDEVRVIRMEELTAVWLVFKCDEGGGEITEHWFCIS